MPAMQKHLSRADEMNIGPQLRSLIEATGLSLVEFAQHAEMSPQRLNDILHDRWSPTIGTIERLARTLDRLLPGGCAAADLLPSANH